MAQAFSKDEAALRLGKFCDRMDRKHSTWETALFVSKVNQYYFTGTMQEGLLIITRDRTAQYFVRRSYERALEESPLDDIFPMAGYRDVAAKRGATLGEAYVETEIMTVAILERLRKYFKMTIPAALDKDILYVRAVKTSYELSAHREAGRLHNALMMTVVPQLLHEGMSENDLCADILHHMYKSGYHGVNRFQMFQTDLGIGQVGFGVNTLYPTNFDGPGGHVGLSPVAPVMGSRKRQLRPGDLVFVDTGFGVGGYNSDKSQAYIFRAKPTEEMQRAQEDCIALQQRIATMLRPGVLPSTVYKTVVASLSDAQRTHFMGYGDRTVKFLGHGVGLHVDEYPVIAEGFDEPFEENMVLALEPKKGVPNVGLVGVEDTYVITADGASCLTGGGCPIIEVGS